MVLRSSIRNDLIQALVEIQTVDEIFSRAGVTSSGLKTISVPTWRGDIAPGIVSEIALLPSLKVFVGVKTPAVAIDASDLSRVFKTRFVVWVWEYSGQISGKTVIAVDCIVHGAERVWWSAAHIGNGRSGLVDDLCARLELDRIKMRSEDIDVASGLEEARHIAEWVHDTSQLIAKLGKDHASYRARRKR